MRARARETERRIVLGYKRGQDDRTVTGPPKLLACGNGSGTINSWLESSWNILHASPFAWAAPSLPRRTLSSNGFHRTTTRSYLKVLDEKCTYRERQREQKKNTQTHTHNQTGKVFPFSWFASTQRHRQHSGQLQTQKQPPLDESQGR